MLVLSRKTLGIWKIPMNYQRLVFFGDSWTYGDAVDSGCDISEYDQKTDRIYDNYPSIMGRSLNKDILNLAIPGNNNRSIYSQLIESHVLKKINALSDVIIIALSAWSRDFEWNPKSELIQVCERVIPDLMNSYVTKNLWNDLKDIKNLKDDTELAYQTVVNFIGISSFLRSYDYKFYIGTVFELDMVFDKIDPRLENYFTSEQRFLPTPFLKFTRWRDPGPNPPGHPNVYEHRLYSDYIINAIKNDKTLA
jgi:hypothetical protein